MTNKGKMSKCQWPDGMTIKLDGCHELDPCVYGLMEEYENVTIQILRCEKCGHMELTWRKQEDTVQTYSTEE